MPANTAILDEVFDLIQQTIQKDERVSATDPLASNPAGTSGVPYRALTIIIDEQPFAILGLTLPDYSIQASSFTQNLARRAIARKAPYLVFTNLRENVLLETPRKAEQAGELVRQYPLLFHASGVALGDPEKTDLLNRYDAIIRDLLLLKKDGQLFVETPDADYFVARLVRAVDKLKPAVKSALISEMSIKPNFAKEMADWAIPQGIPADLKSEAFSEAVVRQAIYRLLGKIIFYQSLRRARPELPELDLAHLDSSQVLRRLYACFAKAHEIDYHAVFREDVIDRLPFPEKASYELRDLVEDLNTRDFAHLPQDVVGAVFERLIPPEDRHALGQFFTPEPLVDLINGFCVRHPGDAVLDPTCGTGTFLIRAYDRLRTCLGVYDHSRLLGQLWGADIAPFPAELATINLFRQQVENTGNFPRVLNEDFFKVVPGGRYRFPPLKPDLPISESPALEAVDEPIPQFDAIIGNFPYISADRIEQAQKNYLSDVIYRRLADEWLQAYPEGFLFPDKKTAKEFSLAREKGLPAELYKKSAQPNQATFSDLYAYLFWHAAAFLKPGGRMGIVTSNAWLDVGFGYGLQRFFLDNFKVIAILESRCEPWFEQAAVNTVVTILERCESAEERDAYPTHFVKIKVPLAELIPWDLHHDALNRWLGINQIVHKIEAVWQSSTDPDEPFEWEDEQLRVRTMQQAFLRQQVEESRKTVKWGIYLRAPKVYFNLLKSAKNKLTLLGQVAPPSRGSLTGINEFYHLSEAVIQQWGIESEFLLPLLKSPGDSDRILINQDELALKVFVCRRTKEELKQQGKIHALKYIEWGEKQVFPSGAQSGLTWPNGAEVRGRKPGWYALPEYRGRLATLFIASAYGDRFIFKYSPKPLIADKRLYFLSPIEELNDELIAALMNSTITAFFIEITGRISLGDGALELTVEDASDYMLIPDIRKFSDQQRQAITDAFKPLLQRPIGSIVSEITQPDRIALDSTILEALGLNASEWLPKIYDGLTTLVRERIELGKKRSQRKAGRPQKAAGKVLDDTLEELLPDGPRRFPEDFYSPAARSGAFREVSLPQSPLRYIGPMFGKHELESADGQKLQVNSPFEVQFVLHAQAAGQATACLPQQPVEISRTVNEYKKYLRDLRKQLAEALFRRTLDQAQAQRLLNEAWKKLNLPDPEQ